MTMETISMILNAMMEGTLAGICISFWLFIIAMIWKWFVNILKKMFKYLFPNMFKKSDNN